MERMTDKAAYYIKIVDARLSESTAIQKSFYAGLYEAMRYSLLIGGKRIRPLLSMAVCELLGVDFWKHLNYACAIEMIHTYSLIHDDLPAMDNDDHRRGKLTSHKVYGEGKAILAGDGLLNKAAIVLANEVIDASDPINAAHAMRFILDSAGPDGMIAGQFIDLDSEGQAIEQEKLKLMHTLKTGALIKASVCFPAILEGKYDKLSLLENMAGSIGLAFQIKDDILDVEGDDNQLGKRTGSDQAKNKMTYVSEFGLERSREILATETENALSLSEKIGGMNDFLNYLIHIISSRQS